MSKNKRILIVFMIVLLCFSYVTVFAAESANVTAIKTYDDAGTHTLTLDGDVRANGCDGAIYVDNATELTINGTGNVHGLVCSGEKCQDETCGFSMAVYANNGSTITINGGTYTQGSDGTDHSDLIYAARQSEIIINGGTFESVTPQWTLNCKDNTNSTITVKGGRFYKFDPSNTTVSPVGQNEIIVPAEYKVVKDGDWYEVVCAHLNCTEVAEVKATYTETGTKAHWLCELCGKTFADKTLATEVVDLTIPKLAEVVDNNATITIDAIDQALSEAGKNATVEIPVLETEEVVNSITLPIISLDGLADKEKELLIETSEVTLTIDNTTLTEIVAQAGDVENVTIEVIKVEEKTLNETQKEAIKDKEVAFILSAQILVDGKCVTDFNGGKVTVEVPFVPAKNVEIAEYKVVYIADDGKVEEIPFKYVDGNIVLELNHFSEYAIVKNKNVQNETEKNESAPVETGKNESVSDEGEKDESPKTGAESIVVFVIIVSIIGLAITKKRK